RRVRPADEVGDVPLPGLRADEAAVAGFLQRQLRVSDAGEHRPGRVRLVRPEERAGSRHRDLVVPTCPAFSGHQVVPAVMAVNVRSFGIAGFCAGEDDDGVADETPLLPIKSLYFDAAESIAAGPPVSAHGQQPGAAVLVVEQ